MWDYFLDLLLKQVLSQPFILIALVVLIGYLALGEKVSNAIIGALKASLGILVMGMGSSALTANFGKILTAINAETGITGAGLNTYPTMTAAQEIMDSVLASGVGASWGLYTFLAAFIINVVLVALRKYTKIKAVYLTGNAALVQTGISAFLVWKFFNLPIIPTVLVAALITALYWGVFSTMLIKPTYEITGADFTVAHQQMFTSWCAYKIAPRLGNPEKDDIEKKQMPSSLKLLQDNIISTFLVMFLSLAVIFVILGGGGIDWLRGADGLAQVGLKNNVIFLFWTAVMLTANIYVLLAGVRMFVGEIMMSFQGISQKILPGAVAGVDCAALFAFAPKSVVLGFLCGAIGQVIGVLLLVAFSSPVLLIPGFIPMFFDNATVAIFANKYGGYKAAIIICVVHGIIQILGSALAVMMTGLSWWQGSGDYATVWVAIIAAFKGLGSVLGIPMAA